MGLQSKQQGISESWVTIRYAKYVKKFFILTLHLTEISGKNFFRVHSISESTSSSSMMMTQFRDERQMIPYSIRMWRTTNGSTRLEIVEIWLSVLFLFVFLLLFCHKLCQSDNLELYFDDDDVYWFISFDINPSIAIIKVWSTKLLRNSRMQLSDVP